MLIFSSRLTKISDRRKFQWNTSSVMTTNWELFWILPHWDTKNSYIPRISPWQLWIGFIDGAVALNIVSYFLSVSLFDTVFIGTQTSSSSLEIHTFGMDLNLFLGRNLDYFKRNTLDRNLYYVHDEKELSRVSCFRFTAKNGFLLSQNRIIWINSFHAQIRWVNIENDCYAHKLSE